MTTTPNSHEQIPARRSRSKQKGTVLIFTVVVLLILAALGATYLQVARTERLTFAPEPNIEAVVQSVIAYIAQVLEQDLKDNAGKLFNPADASAGGMDEPYDYPWTADTVSGGIIGQGDDTWLASTAVDMVAGVPVWAHVTNLMNEFVRIPSSGNVPTIAVSNSSTGAGNDTNVPISTASNGLNSTSGGTIGHDADGDGAPDSKWSYAPIKQIGSFAYIMAVRIIDNSSLINVNTATALTSDGDNNFGAVTNGPFGTFPTDIDLSRLLKRRVATTAWMGELATNGNSLFQYRGLTQQLPLRMGIVDIVPNFPTVADPIFRYPSYYVFPFSAVQGGTNTWEAGSRAGAWLATDDGGRHYQGSSSKHFKLLPDEKELRYRGGLNDSGGTTDLETRMPQAMRATATEATFGAVVGGTTNTNIGDWFLGTSHGGAVASRTYPALRHMLTTVSGSSIAAPQYDALSTNREKYDLTNEDFGHNPYAFSSPAIRHGILETTEDPSALHSNFGDTRIANVADRIKRVLETGTPAYDTDTALLTEAARDLSLNIRSYAGAATTPSRIRNDGAAFTPLAAGGTGFYGIEAMPFIREVYLQAAYGAAVNEWAVRDGSQAMVIELANPFDKPIIIADYPNRGGVNTDKALHLRVVVYHNGVQQGHTDTILANHGNGTNRFRIVLPNGTDLSPVATATTDGGTATLAPGGRLLVVQNGTINGITDSGVGGVRNNLINDLALTRYDSTKDLIVRNAGNSRMLNFPIPMAAGDELVIEMQVLVQRKSTWSEWWTPGTYITYERFRIRGAEFATTYPNPTNAPGDRHRQISFARDGRGLRFMAAKAGNASESVIASRIPDAIAPVGYRRFDNTPVERLTFATKGSITGDTTLGSADTFTDANARIPWRDGTIVSPAEILGIPLVAFFDGPNGDVPARMTARPSHLRFLDIFRPLPTVIGVPHAMMLVDQFTTVGPRHDGVDNNGDGVTDDANETLVHGQINVNTAPLHILTLTAPINQSIAANETLMTRLISYRDTPAGRGGIVSGQWGSVINNLRNKPGIASMGELMLINADDRTYNLTQAYTTRSDIFTAYIEVRAYPVSDFGAGYDARSRIIATFDRSTAHTATGGVNVIMNEATD